MVSEKKPFPQKITVQVVGGGFSGLTLAYFLVQEGFAVEIFEKQNRWGGLLGSHLRPTGLVEQAANGFLCSRRLEEISQNIAVPLVEKSSMARKRYIFRKGRPSRWPLGFWGTLKVLKFFIVLSLRRKSMTPHKGDSLEHWGHRHLGEEATQYLLGPAFQGVHGRPPQELSAKLVLQGLFGRGRPPRGTLRGTVSPQGGMGQWIGGLREFLKNRGVVFYDQREVSKEEVLESSENNKIWAMATNFLGAKNLLHHLGESCGWPRVGTTELSSLTVHWPKNSKKPPEGFGCLFPQKEGFHSLGVLYNSDIFPDRASENTYSETWIFGPERDSSKQEQSLENDDKKYFDFMLKDRQKMGYTPGKPLHWERFRWAEAIPQYNEDLEDVLECWEERESVNPPQGSLAKIYFLGNYLGVLGLAQIVEKAFEVSQKISKDQQD